MISRLIYTLLLIGMGSTSYTQVNDVWVVSNIELDKSKNEIDNILKKQNYSKDDIIIFHGNALNGGGKINVNRRIKELRSKFARVFIIPGDTDWNTLKSQELKSLGDYLDDEYKGDVIVPENACGVVEIKNVTDDLSIVFIDSYWYFSDWSEDRYINNQCEVISRVGFWDELKGAIGGLKAKQVLLFARNPVFRNDGIGGHLSLKQHLLPLPILGTLINDTKNYLHPNNNTLSPIYQEYISQMKEVLKGHTQIALISSDANVSSIYDYKGNYQININSSTKKGTKHKDNRLIYQNNKPTFLNLNVEDDNVMAHLFNAKNGEKIYSQLVLSGKPFVYNKSEFVNFDSRQLNKKVKRRIRLAEDRVNLNSFIFGSLNKDLYDLEVEVDILNLEEYKEGLTPLRLGGGMQTNSMRLADKNENVYVTRSLKKMPEKALPPGLDGKPFVMVMENFFMAADPLAFLTTPVIDNAAGVYHTTPELLLLARQPKLSMYNDQIGGELVLFRERADEAWPNKKSYGNSENIISSSSMIGEMAENKAVPDADMFLRARLLDIVLGDWDRHKDQWRWAEGNGAEKNKYFPIARDRDQVYSNFDGLFIKLFRPYSVNLLQLRKFDDKLTPADIRWMHWKSSYLDNLILTELDEESWEKQTEFIKSSITEGVIEKSMEVLPSSYNKRKEVLSNNLNARIDAIDQISNDFRSEFLDRIVLRASNDNDSIRITQAEKEITIDIYTNYKSVKKSKIRSYTYNEEETNDIWVYGLEKDDVFIMEGKRTSGIDVTLIGGYNEDKYYSKSKFKNITIIDDEPKDDIEKLTNTKYRFIENKKVHDLGRVDLTPEVKFFIPNLMYNTDDGFTVGGSYTWINRGFKSIKTHNVSANYLTARRSSLFSYNYNKEDLLTQMTHYIEANWSGLRRQMNFYGGNGSENTEINSFYQVGISDVRLEIGKGKRLNSITSLTGGVYAWSVRVEDNGNRFVNKNNEIVDIDLFDRSSFAGLKLNLTLQNSDNTLRPTKLGRISITADYKFATNIGRSNILFDFEYDFYKPLIGEERLIFSTRLKAGHLIGDYYIYEGFQLGGSEFLRGYRNGRFTGKSILAQNTNLHLKLVDELFGDSFSCSAGVSGGFDHGRTWSEYDLNDKWQYSYGGGVWISPLDQAVLSAGLYRNDERNQLRILFNWQF